MRSTLLFALLLSASLCLVGCVECTFDPTDYEERGTTVITLRADSGCSGAGAHLVMIDGLYWTTSPGLASTTTLPMRLHVENGRHTVKVLPYDLVTPAVGAPLLDVTVEVAGDTTLVVPCGP